MITNLNNNSKIENSSEDNNNSIDNKSKLAKEFCEQGRRMLRENKDDEALELFDKCLVIDNTYSGAYFGKGIIHLNKNDLAKARVDFDNCIRVNKNNYAAFLNLGVVFERRGEHEKAIMMITKSV